MWLAPALWCGDVFSFFPLLWPLFIAMLNASFWKKEFREIALESQEKLNAFLN
jgi:hypothetical protein